MHSHTTGRYGSTTNGNPYTLSHLDNHGYPHRYLTVVNVLFFAGERDRGHGTQGKAGTGLQGTGVAQTHTLDRVAI